MIWINNNTKYHLIFFSSMNNHWIVFINFSITFHFCVFKSLKQNASCYYSNEISHYFVVRPDYIKKNLAKAKRFLHSTRPYYEGFFLNFFFLLSFFLFPFLLDTPLRSMSLTKQDTHEPLPYIHFLFLLFSIDKPLHPLIFPSFSIKLIHLYLVKSLMKPDTLGATKLSGHLKKQINPFPPSLKLWVLDLRLRSKGPCTRLGDYQIPHISVLSSTWS